MLLSKERWLLSENRLYYTVYSLLGNARYSIAQREKSNIFFSLLTWTPPETPGVSKEAPGSIKLEFEGLVP